MRRSLGGPHDVGRLARFCLAWWLAWFVLGAIAEPQRSVLDLDLQQQPVALQDWGDWRIDPTGRATPEAVLRDEAGFRPTLAPGSPYPLKAGEALWIRIAVPATSDEQRWYLKLRSAGLDAVADIASATSIATCLGNFLAALRVNQAALPDPALVAGASRAERSRALAEVLARACATATAQTR